VTARGRLRWIALAALPPAAAILTVVLAPSPHGHWSEHLSTAGLKATQLVVLFCVALLVGLRRLPVALLVGLGIVAVGIVAQVHGDVQVAQSL